MRKLYVMSAIIFSGAITFAVWYKTISLQQLVYPLEQCSASIAYPFLVMQHKIVGPIKDHLAQRAQSKIVSYELKKKASERDALLAQNIELRSMIDYMQEVSELIEFKKRYNYEQGALAQILVLNCTNKAHFCLVDRGSCDGICPDMVAIYKDCIVDKVVQVYPHYSKVLLMSDKECRVAAVCSESKALGIYHGNNDDCHAHLEHVSHLSQVQQGDLIVSTGEGLVFPRGFGLGRVKQWKRNGLFYHIEVEPLINIHTLKHCYLVQKGSHLMSTSEPQSHSALQL